MELVQGGVAGEEASVPYPAAGGVSEMNALCCGGMLRVQPGDYSLVHDGDGEADQHTLDALLYFSAEGWPPHKFHCSLLLPSAFSLYHICL